MKVLIRAQRLSASLESSHVVAMHAICLAMCSTPFGIIGIFTRLFPFLYTLFYSVLNAFRHHWNLHVSCNFEPKCEYRCSTPFGIIGIFTSERPTTIRRLRVLNAFRHHWNLHIQVCAVYKLNRKCSTPFGIIGIFTSLKLVVENSQQAVLNAFRHHWNLHRIVVTSSQLKFPSAQRLSASLESSRLGMLRVFSKPVGAQRLSASLESSPRGSQTMWVVCFRNCLSGIKRVCEICNGIYLESVIN